MQRRAHTGEHLAVIAEALGLSQRIVESAAEEGDLLALTVAAGVRHLRMHTTGEAPADDAPAWLPELLASAADIAGENEFTARDLREAAEVPFSPPHERLTLALAQVGGGRCPAPAVLGKALRAVVGRVVNGMALSEVSRRDNVSRYCIERGQ
jgi:hypothetical protein